MALKGLFVVRSLVCMNYAEAVASFVSAMAYLQQAECRKLDDPSFVIEDRDDLIQFAAEGMAWLKDNGHVSQLYPVMEMLQASSWYLSPDEDVSLHCVRLQRLFAEVAEAAEILPQLDEDRVDDDEVFEFSAEKDHLLRCLQAS